MSVLKGTNDFSFDEYDNEALQDDSTMKKASIYQTYSRPNYQYQLKPINDYESEQIEPKTYTMTTNTLYYSPINKIYTDEYLSSASDNTFNINYNITNSQPINVNDNKQVDTTFLLNQRSVNINNSNKYPDYTQTPTTLQSFTINDYLEQPKRPDTKIPSWVDKQPIVQQQPLTSTNVNNVMLNQSITNTRLPSTSTINNTSISGNSTCNTTNKNQTQNRNQKEEYISSNSTNIELVSMINELYKELDKIKKLDTQFDIQIKDISRTTQTANNEIIKDVNDALQTLETNVNKQLTNATKSLTDELSTKIQKVQLSQEKTTTEIKTDVDNIKKDSKNLVTKYQVLNIVNSELQTVRDYAEQLVEKYRRSLGNIVTYINEVPKKIHDSSIDFANNVATKLQQIADALEGGEKNKNMFAQLRKTHISYLDKLRQKDMQMYKQLVLIAKSYVLQKNSSNVNPNILKQYELQLQRLLLTNSNN